ncbi:MAG: TIGR00282 family metallophosphoesterase [Candidatus Tectomicrobia bacterium]|uniref:TIGR00282 family metallophosphoesterase n=1 Tax=Tectimicrobiota bacterium TaxID=2528274 RepID=A0A932FZU7_UNCTE|nr:TIGR00282 family metallophosphoesterase [Candidatus Tectomicrobia bacterium]
MRILFIGDIMGKAGRKAVEEFLPGLVASHQIDLCIGNCENAAGGFGVTPEIAEQLFQMGFEVLTSGNHIWDKKEVLPYLERQGRLLRPANYPPEAPGTGSVICEARSGKKVAVLNLQGRVFMECIDCPFKRADQEIPRLRSQTPIIVVDMHAETTSEKNAMGWYLDGRVSAVVGTHTHVPTADETILPAGTAYITDVGMTGPADSIIGIEKEPALRRFLHRIPQKFDPAKGPGRLQAVLLEIDAETGRAQGITRVRVP